MGITTPCDRSYPAYHSSGTRKNPRNIKWVVLHSTEGGTAKSVAQMFSRPEATASTHLVVDELECYRMLDDKRIPWGAPGANTYGYHIEQCGYASWAREEWLKHDLTLRRSAYKAAIRCVEYDIPLRWVGKLGLKLGRKGITTHNDCSQAFNQGGHYDPGPNFPKDVWMGYAKYYFKTLGGGKQWL